MTTPKSILNRIEQIERRANRRDGPDYIVLDAWGEPPPGLPIGWSGKAYQFISPDDWDDPEEEL